MRSPYEIKTEKALQADGWITDYKIRPRMCPRGYKVDYWGLFDILAYKAGKVRFISVKGHAGVPSWHSKALSEFVPPYGCTKEIWVYRKRGLDILVLDSGST